MLLGLFAAVSIIAIARAQDANPNSLYGRDSTQGVYVRDSATAVEKFARVLLRRYGVMFRRLLERESLSVSWYELGRVYRRFEARGEIRGGYFIAGVSGEQFALPEAVDSLRAMRKAKQAAVASPAAENLAAVDAAITISAADPLNLVGIIVPGDRVPAISGKFVTFNDGVATTAETPSIAVMEARG